MILLDKLQRLNRHDHQQSDTHQHGQALCVSNLRLLYPLPENRFLPVLHIPSLCIAAASMVAITGLSGSGKTFTPYARKAKRD